LGHCKEFSWISAAIYLEAHPPPAFCNAVEINTVEPATALVTLMPAGGLRKLLLVAVRCADDNLNPASAAHAL
jgi:hypothetical protein